MASEEDPALYLQEGDRASRGMRVGCKPQGHGEMKDVAFEYSSSLVECAA